MACFKPHTEPLDGVEHIHFYPKYEGPAMQPVSSKDRHMGRPKFILLGPPQLRFENSVSEPHVCETP